MKYKDSPHTATHNELYTSICTMFNKLVVHPSLAYEGVLIISRKLFTSVSWFKIKRLQNSINMEFLHVLFPIWFKTVVSLESDLLIISCDVLASVFMDVISPTRFIRVHPSSMNMVIIWTTIVLIIPEQNNNYLNKSWRLGLIPTRNTITLYMFSMRIIPYSFASYLGTL